MECLFAKVDWTDADNELPSEMGVAGPVYLVAVSYSAHPEFGSGFRLARVQPLNRNPRRVVWVAADGISAPVESAAYGVTHWSRLPPQPGSAGCEFPWRNASQVLPDKATYGPYPRAWVAISHHTHPEWGFKLQFGELRHINGDMSRPLWVSTDKAMEPLENSARGVAFWADLPHAPLAMDELKSRGSSQQSSRPLAVVGGWPVERRTSIPGQGG